MKLIISLLLSLTIFVSTIKSQLILVDLFSSNENTIHKKDPTCSINLGGKIIKEGECVFLNSYPTILGNRNDGKIEITIFNKTDYYCENEIINKKSYGPDECFVLCPIDIAEESCTTLKFSQIQNVKDVSTIIPSNTLVNVYYGNDCDLNGDSWKSNFVWIEYYLMNTCDVTFLDKNVAFKVYCNSTDSIVNVFNAPTCFGVTSNIITSPLYNQCGSAAIDSLNIVQICNSNGSDFDSSTFDSSNDN